MNYLLLQIASNHRAHFQRDPCCLTALILYFTASHAHIQAYPTHVGVHKIAEVVDLTVGYDSRTANHVAAFPKQSGQLITFYLDQGGVITFRTSGTEPKIKFYSELRVAVPFVHICACTHRLTCVAETVKWQKPARTGGWL